jgi:hypothetical protein
MSYPNGFARVRRICFNAEVTLATLVRNGQLSEQEAMARCGIVTHQSLDKVAVRFSDQKHIIINLDKD